MRIIITEQQYNRAIDKFISYFLEPHEVKTSSEYPNSLFWIKDGEVIAEIKKVNWKSLTSENFWLHYRIWTEITEQFGFEYDETQSVINTWLEQHYNMRGLTTGSGVPLIGNGWNKIIKMGD